METKPFDQLSEDDQKAAIDVSVATVLIGLRIPSAGKALYDWMATEFAGDRKLSPNVVKYALRSLGKTLYEQDWTMTIQKKAGTLTTRFVPANAGGENGEEGVSRIIH